MILRTILFIFFDNQEAVAAAQQGCLQIVPAIDVFQEFIHSLHAGSMSFLTIQ